MRHHLLQAIISLMQPIDWLALACFVLVWFGYAWLADYYWARRGLVGISHLYREEWMREMLCRENHVVDSALVGNLISSVSFFASTTMYIIAGLMAMMGTMERAISFTADLPFVREASKEVWEIKLLLLMIIFVHAYFKFTWSLRQFNLLSILIGGAPTNTDDEVRNEIYIQKAGAINSLAGDEFNRGIRAYYFGLATLTWFLHPWAFMLATLIVTVVLFRRDYLSHTWQVLSQYAPTETPRRLLRK